jgi:hypothetical protein
MSTGHWLKPIKSMVRPLARQLRRPRPLLQLLSDEEVQRHCLREAEQICKIRDHLSRANKAISAAKRPHVFLAVHHVNWERHGLVDPWREIADVTHYEWGDSFDQYSRDWHRNGKLRFNEALFQRVRDTHDQKPIDLFFSYLSGRWVYAETIRNIGALGCVTTNIGFDDTLQFWGHKEASGLSGNADIASSFDVCITCGSERDVGRYIGVGARPLFLPPGVNPQAFEHPKVERDIPISFVGQCYGKRPAIVEYLRANGVAIQTFGRGWPGGEVSLETMKEIYARSVINMGFGYTGGSSSVVLKGRDFEVPVSGGLYLTSYNAEMEKYFTPGKEIEFYHDETELLRKFSSIWPTLILRCASAQWGETSV